MYTISPGHFGKGTGAVGLVDEATEARRVAREVVSQLKRTGAPVQYIDDTQSKNQRANIHYLVAAHNKTVREYDISIHFNAVDGMRVEGIGTEVLYVNPAVKELAEQISTNIAAVSGLKNRGAKYRTDLGFLNGTAKKALIIEVCFVNSREDVATYQQHFQAICRAITTVLAGDSCAPQLSSPALTARMQAIWSNEEHIIAQLTRGVADGVFHAQWLAKAKSGNLSVQDYMALSTLQLVAGNKS